MTLGYRIEKRWRGRKPRITDYVIRRERERENFEEYARRLREQIKDFDGGDDDV